MALSTFVGERPVAWDRDQRVVDPGIIRSGDAYHHGLTGAMVACYMVRGRWSDAALMALHSALAVALPERHSSRITNYAEARIAVYLGVWPSYETSRNDLPPLERADDLRAVLACSAWVMNQGLAALGRGHPRGVDRPEDLPAPATDVLDRFCLADEALGDQWVPDGFPHHRGMGGPWTVLRESSPFDIRTRL